MLAREGQLVQVFVNVLTNAAQAIPASSDREHVISVSTKRGDAGRVVVTISDSGCGIDESALSHVFEPFYTGKRRGKGSGLGLPISKRIIDSLGGHMRIESEVDHGTSVHIELVEAEPVTPSERQTTHANTEPPSRTPHARVLVVDDERPLARTLKRLLSAHEVVLAYDGSHAYDILQGDEHFDVILCDLMMPGMSGADLYRRVSELRPELEPRFIFMTGGSMSEHSDAFVETVRSRMLTKPFDPERMLECVEEAARRASFSSTP
ncbi:MAG: ATP-binding protein [Polyangiaceae bacterium]